MSGFVICPVVNVLNKIVFCYKVGFFKSTVTTVDLYIMRLQVLWPFENIYYADSTYFVF